MVNVLLILLASNLAVCLDGHGAFPGSVVRTIGDPVLKETAPALTDEELRCANTGHAALAGGCGAPAEAWIALMLRGLRETNGAAIAAPQVGISKRLVVMAIPRERVREERQAGSVVSAPVVLINPQLWPTGDNLTDVWETCLSLPGEKVVVRRHSIVRYRAQRLDGAVMEGEASGRLGLTLQHEVDHLNGVLMTDVGMAEPAAGSMPRADGLGAVTSTEHWDLMKEPGYSLRTAMFHGASLSTSGHAEPDIDHRALEHAHGIADEERGATASTRMTKATNALGDALKEFMEAAKRHEPAEL